MGLGVALLSVFSVSKAIIGTVQQMENARKAENQKTTEQFEVARQSQIQQDNLRRDARQVQAQQLSGLASAGVDITDIGGTGMELSRDIDAALQRNLDITRTNAAAQWYSLESEKNLIPSQLSIAATGAFGLGADLASIGMKASKGEAEKKANQPGSSGSGSSGSGLLGPVDTPYKPSGNYSLR